MLLRHEHALLLLQPTALLLHLKLVLRRQDQRHMLSTQLQGLSSAQGTQTCTAMGQTFHLIFEALVPQQCWLPTARTLLV